MSDDYDYYSGTTSGERIESKLDDIKEKLDGIIELLAALVQQPKK